jgi:hypothetical protein
VQIQNLDPLKLSGCRRQKCHVTIIYAFLSSHYHSEAVAHRLLAGTHAYTAVALHQLKGQWPGQSDVAEQAPQAALVALGNAPPGRQVRNRLILVTRDLQLSRTVSAEDPFDRARSPNDSTNDSGHRTLWSRLMET